MVPHVRVLDDLGERVVAIHVEDLREKSTSVASLGHLEAKLDVRTVVLHDLSRYHADCLPAFRKQLLQRRNALKSQSGWDCFESIEPPGYQRILVAGSNKDKRKYAKKLALLAAITLRNCDEARQLCPRDADFIQEVLRTWTEASSAAGGQPSVLSASAREYVPIHEPIALGVDSGSQAIPHSTDLDNRASMRDPASSSTAVFSAQGSCIAGEGSSEWILVQVYHAASVEQDTIRIIETGAEDFAHRTQQSQKERADATAMQDNVLAEEIAQKRKDYAERQRLDAEKIRLEQEERILAQQAEEQKQIARDLAKEQQALAEEKRRFEIQRRAGEDSLALPNWWSAMGSDGLAVIAERCPRVLSALGALLVVDNPEHLGFGRDHCDWHDRPYKRLALECAWRIQNPAIWRKYRAEVLMMQNSLHTCGITLPSLGLREGFHQAGMDLPGGTGQEYVNECFLLHGTRPNDVVGIMNEGLNERFCGRGAFGFGSYLAEDAGKIDQYVRQDRQFMRSNELHQILYSTQIRHPGTVYYVFVCRTALGLPVRTYDGNQSTDGASNVWADAKSRAARRELAYAPGSRPALRYHSEVVEVTPDDVYARASTSPGVCRYREFVITHSDRIYPEYLIAYRRVPR